MTSATFKHHFDMISLNEPVQRKARFWTSYVRALKGTEDMRADDGALKTRRPFSDVPDLFPRIFDDIPTSFTEDPAARVKAPGYKYLPVSRETYGYNSPVSRETSAPAPTAGDRKSRRMK